MPSFHCLVQRRILKPPLIPAGLNIHGLDPRGEAGREGHPRALSICILSRDNILSSIFIFDEKSLEMRVGPTDVFPEEEPLLSNYLPRFRPPDWPARRAWRRGGAAWRSTTRHCSALASVCVRTGRGPPRDNNSLLSLIGHVKRVEWPVRLWPTYATKFEWNSPGWWRCTTRATW